jgi:hypothetical protein
MHKSPAKGQDDSVMKVHPTHTMRTTMADIIPLLGRMPATDRRKALAPPPSEPLDAQILLFTGVRYERVERVYLINEPSPEGNHPGSGTGGPCRH